MNFIHILCVSILCASLSGCDLVVHQLQWAEQDLQYIHTAVVENHPGMHNELDPLFKDNLSLHYQIAQDQLKVCTTDEQKVEVIRAFIKSFNDAHMQIHYKELQQNNAQQQPKRNPFGITDLDNHICWIILPTFQPNTQEKESLQAIIETLAKKQLTFTENDHIVFDIRGNGGGNSFFAQDIVQALFGELYMHYCMDKAGKNLSVDWRASQGNIAYLQQFKEKHSNDSQQNDFVQWLTHTIEGMEQALHNSKPYFTQKNSEQGNTPKESLLDPLKAHIIVIINKHCFSAALDFIDYLKVMDHNVVLIGEKTGADSLYMDINQSELPSQKGNFALPMKVYRNRVRGHNEPYIPDIAYHDDINDTELLQQFVKSHIRIK